MHVTVMVFMPIYIKADDIAALVGIGLMLFPSIVTQTLKMIAIELVLLLLSRFLRL